MAEKEESLVNDIERHKEQIHALAHKNSVLENILDYKDEQVDTLKKSRHILKQEKLIGPAANVLPELVDIMNGSATKGAYSLDMLLRYTPSGSTEHLGEDGTVMGPPAWDAVSSEWSEFGKDAFFLFFWHRSCDIIIMMTNLTNHAITSSICAVEKFKLLLHVASDGAAYPELQQQQEMATSNEQQQATDTVGGHTNNGNANTVEDGDEEVLINNSKPIFNLNMDWEESANDLSTVDSTSHSTASSLMEVALTTVEPKHQVVTDLWQKSGGHLESLAARMIGVGDLDQGTALYADGITYRFTGPLLKKTAKLLHTAGVLFWQQAVLFPDTMIRFSSANIVTGEPGNPEELENIDRWRAVVKSLDLRKEQLQNIVLVHRQFLSSVRPVHRERAAIMSHLQECESLGGVHSSVQAHIKASLELGECATGLAQTVRKEYAAWLKFCGAVFRTLDFPLQRTRFVTLSWPYWPQHNIIGTCAALELGINPSSYMFENEGWRGGGAS